MTTQASSTPAKGDKPNPFQQLIVECHNDPAAIRARYSEHRSIRALQQRAALIPPDALSPGVSPDTILKRLLDASANAENIKDIDPRHNLTVWARPTTSIQTLIASIQSRLTAAVPQIWCPPPGSLHMTVAEVAHSRSRAEIEELVDMMRPCLRQVEEVFTEHEKKRSVVKLDAPMVSFDRGGVAVGFLPAEDGAFTYHHLRGEVFEVLKPHVPMDSRYIYPSAHVTIARFPVALDDGQIRALAAAIDEVNEMLQVKDGEEGVQVMGEGAHERAASAHVSEEGAQVREGGARVREAGAQVRREGTQMREENADSTEETLRQGQRAKAEVMDEEDILLDGRVQWTVGEEHGLEVRAGQCWYGDGGYTVTKGHALEQA